LPVYHWEVQRDRRLTERLELHRRRGSQKDVKYPRSILVGEMLGPWRGGQGAIGSQLGKGTIESVKLSDGSDTIPFRVPVQGIQLKLEETEPAK